MKERALRELGPLGHRVHRRLREGSLGQGVAGRIDERPATTLVIQLAPCAPCYSHPKLACFAARACQVARPLSITLEVTEWLALTVDDHRLLKGHGAWRLDHTRVVL